MRIYSRKNQEMMKFNRKKETENDQSIIIKYNSESSHRNREFADEITKKKESQREAFIIEVELRGRNEKARIYKMWNVKFTSEKDPLFNELLDLVRAIPYTKLEFPSQKTMIKEIFDAVYFKGWQEKIGKVLKRNDDIFIQRWGTGDRGDWSLSILNSSWDDFVDKCLKLLAPAKLTKLHQLISRKALYIFMLMPFKDELTKIYLNYIQEPLEKRGHKVERADEFNRNELIIKEIQDTISKADILIADLTGNNANVFYEVGYAHAKRNLDRVILLCQQPISTDFDLHGFHAIVYSTETSQNLEKLTTDLITRLESFEA